MLKFDKELARAAAATEKKLGALLGHSPSARLISAMRYSAMGGGKRLRPFLLLQSAALFNVPTRYALRAAAALECVHCYSLVHDDLPAMDDDDLRRGRPTTHKKFDEATAILAGDALLTFAFEILSDRKTHPDAEVQSQLVSELAKAAGKAGMVGGQMLDIEAESKPKQSFAAIKRIQAHKTGALFRLACEGGAILGQADPKPLRHYADHLGLAFQIADDLLDHSATPEQLGKATQKDEAAGKATFISLLGVEGATKAAAREVHSALNALTCYGPEAEMLRCAARFSITRTN